MLPGESPMRHPEGDDPRLQPFMENLHRHGVINDHGVITKPCLFLRKGIMVHNNIGHYIWRAKWINAP